MRVVIIGQKWLAVEVMRLCQMRGDDIAAVIVPSEGDRLAQTARTEGLYTVIAPHSVGGGLIPAGVDVILCAHTHAFVGSSARAKARYGALGYHPSLLPRHRGRDAIRWALHMGDKTTGGTVYWLDDGADTGAIAAQDWCWIRHTDTAQTLWRDILAPMGIRLFAEVLDQLDDGIVAATPQDEQLATFEPSFTRSKLNSP